MPVPEPAATLLALGAATLGEAGGRPMRSRVRAVWAGATLAAFMSDSLVPCCIAVRI